MSAATAEKVTRSQIVNLLIDMGHPEAKVKTWSEQRCRLRVENLQKDVEAEKAHKPKSKENKALYEQLLQSNGDTVIEWADDAEENTVTIAPPEVKGEAEQATASFNIPLRAITGDTDVRNPLSNKMKKDGWTFMDGDKNIWQLAVSETPEARQQFVEMMESECPEIVGRAHNIAAVGQLHPIRVIETGKGTYDFVFGRGRSLSMLYTWAKNGGEGEPMARAEIVEAEEADRILQALSENDELYRKVPSAYEVAQTILYLNKEAKVKLKDIANRYGRTEQWVRDQLALAGIGGDAKKEIVQGKVKKSEAIAKQKKAAKEAKIKEKINKAKKEGKTDQVNELKEKLEKVHAEPVMMRSKTECISAKEEIAPTLKLTAEQFFDWLFCKSKKLA